MNNYTLIELEKDIESIITELAEVRAKKGHDYSGVEDTLDNLRAFGWRGVVVRLGDKFHRLKHYILSGDDLMVVDESIEDTLQDFVNYALFSLILYRQEKTARAKEGFASQGTASEKPKPGIVDWENSVPGGSV